MPGLALMFQPKPGRSEDPENDSEDTSSARAEVVSDLEEAGLKVDDMDLFLSAIRRWCAAPEGDGYEEDSEDSEDSGLMGKMRK
jgi:hypothetical protein